MTSYFKELIIDGNTFDSLFTINILVAVLSFYSHSIYATNGVSNNETNISVKFTS